MSETFRNVLKILKHLAIIGALLIALILGFFYIYLPTITKHGESISVPELEGKNLEELEEFLTSKKLRFEVEPDSGYSAKYPALAVLRQFPLPNSKVKENRKIYVTLNAEKPPVVRVPNLYGISLKDAILQLGSLGLSIGKTEYVPEMGINTVLEWRYKGTKLKGDEEIPKGSKIDFVLADGAGNQKFAMPNFVGREFEDVKVAFAGMGLIMGNVFFEKEGIINVPVKDELGNEVTKEITIEPGMVFRQKPSLDIKDSVRIGESIDLWVVKKDSVDILNITNLDLEEDEKIED